ncbi:response regulator [Pseudomonas sp. nanlin1]|uniref:response regulator n=1 Tax=Pseudomonas sp. nanlin1 TaxID=3040605 RepID=UPI00388DED9F
MATILIVDDEYLIADILSFALEDEGYMVVTASNGMKALEVLDRERPELIITDFMMPVMDGLEFAKTVRERPAFSALPILLMSGAQADIGHQRPDLFIGVFEKPFDIERVIGRVKQILPLGSPP